MAEPQVVPARHGVATFVPAGQSIKIINTSGTQVVDTWAFALPQPAPKRDVDESTKAKEEAGRQETAKAADKVKGKSGDLPSQEEAEQATKEAHEQAEQQDGQKKGWSSYIPSVPTLGLSKKDESSDASKGGDSNETQQQKNSKTWSSYFKPGKGFSSYIPDAATDTVSKFVNVHSRDTNKSYLEQLTDFSKTPVGAAGMSAFTGSGYSGSLYAGYQAWNAKNAADAPAVEFMSMSHTRSATLHLLPQQHDTLVTNLREPILTVVEDKSPGVHDTLIPACDPQRYKALGVDHWEEHGSCAENLVLALKELNERAGLKGAKAVGADVTINSVPAPLNLFMNIPWTHGGDISFEGPKGKAGDYIRLRAERDVVVVMSACPNDVNGINGDKITDANFVVEEEGATDAIKRSQPKKTPVPKMKTAAPSAAPPANTPAKRKPAPASTPSAKTGSSQATSAPKAAPPAKKPPPTKAPPKPSPASAANKAATKPVKKPAPPPVKPQVKSDTTAVPAEKKKPRKLVRQPTQS
ncbi:hypothetical protein Slin15195_G056720 [Septoria linicola]|uniref:DUF1989 domain-containing protein n=1 Tax=Septoria linicola TaxID=215465 RepID=A0A9Q9EKG0_9PEZI|nr:hypothetical protein Slin14017_G072600 [Septoria linicola]USW52353.1 hypothetical protein Slin15195_G056720 [Septoria linicola]